MRENLANNLYNPKDIKLVYNAVAWDPEIQRLTRKEAIMTKVKKPIVKAEPKVVEPKIAKFKPITLVLGEVETYQLKRALEIATAGTCPADIKAVATSILAKLK